MYNEIGCRCEVLRTLAIILVVASVGGITNAAPPYSADTVSLDGAWQFRRSGSTDWKRVSVPNSFEAHEGVEFDGVGIYRKSVRRPKLDQDRRLLIQFDAVATAASVVVNGRLVGTHLGGWTPFQCDLTDVARTVPEGQPLRIEVRVDEKVGHNTQGFLPVFAPHFGGIWQSVHLVQVPNTWFDRTRILCVGNADSGCVELTLPLLGERPAPTDEFRVRYRLLGESTWTPALQRRLAAAHSNATVKMRSDAPPARRAAECQLSYDERQASVLASISVDNYRIWSPDSPILYEVEITLKRGSTVDQIVARAAFRSIRVAGDAFRLNGRPLAIRGILNWGYAPPRVAPSIDAAHWREELGLVKAYGFNLMKFCLWVPPRAYLDLADEMGILTWIEYPTWHSRWSADQLPGLAAEYDEFFCHDRNHPSVILRSLTCETGPSADLNVIRALYDKCHAMVPQAIVEDDSSWIGWNRVHDFYDDHPYGNNHTWVETLDRLKKHIAQRAQKPLVLGEAIAADTWANPQTLTARVGDERPFWLPRFLAGNEHWRTQMAAQDGSAGLATLEQDSLAYALLMRKYQIETYRREVPRGGYVVSVIRDIPSCSMGLIDYLNNRKWPASDWSWHGSTMLLLATDDDRRSFVAGESFAGRIGVTHFGRESWKNAALSIIVDAQQGGRLATQRQVCKNIPNGAVTWLADVNVALPAVSVPTGAMVHATLACDQLECHNAWPIWIVPRADMAGAMNVKLHNSCSASIDQLVRSIGIRESSDPKGAAVTVAQHFDTELFKRLTDGGRVLLLPDGQHGSLPIRDEWFLRGAPYVSPKFVAPDVPRRMLVELQHFDLAGPVMPDLQIIGQIDPLLLLWNNHDLDHVKSQGLVFATRVGKGQLLVSALRHNGKTNAAGRWLLACLLRRLAGTQVAGHGLNADTVRRMQLKLTERKLNLTDRNWRFRPDGENQGLQLGWHQPGTADREWKTIRVGTAWEGAGYPKLDGWAWYRIRVKLPGDWKAQPVYFSIEGADDYYELYVNGQLAGSGGNIEKHETAFEQRASHDISRFRTPGQEFVLAVRVYDWYGAGGLFRPIYLSSVPIDRGVRVLQ